MAFVLAAACVLAAIPAGLRWLRVAQREHYLAPSVSRFALRWWTSGPANIAIAIASVGAVIGSLWQPWLAFLVVLAQFGPVGMTVKGRTSKLSWTPRLRRLAAVSGALAVIAFVIGAMTGVPLITAAGLLLLPALVDLALVLLTPVESMMGDRWVSKAAGRLAGSAAAVVAITGSYGKTTTKAYAAQLVSGTRRVVASPASFNNRMGLARAVNEQLVPGTEVFIAEMGTYGRGEIASLCEWVRPDVAALVALGPVHLERFRTLEAIVEAKSEILDRAKVGVVAIDHPLLAELARARSATMEIITAGTGGTDANVVVCSGQVVVDGAVVGDLPAEALEVNAAVAVGICLALGMDTGQISAGLGGLTGTEHRQALTRTESGITVIDDTYNSNPAGVASALDLLEGLAGKGKKAVVTPGMVELGPLQREENVTFARRAAGEADALVIVGRTNRSALIEGSAKGKAAVTVVDTRDEAVAWVRDNLGEGDTVLYENDLPDHYP